MNNIVQKWKRVSGGILAMCLSMSTFAQTEVKPGQTLEFTAGQGTPLRLVESCGGATTNCNVGYDLNNNPALITEIITIGPTADQLTTLGGGRKFSFKIVSAELPPDSDCPAGNVPVLIQSATKYDGNIAVQTPTVGVPGDVFTRLTHGMELINGTGTANGGAANSRRDVKIAVETVANETIVDSDRIGTSQFTLSLNLAVDQVYSVIFDGSLYGECGTCIDLFVAFSSSFAYEGLKISIGIDEAQLLCRLNEKIDVIDGKIDVIDVKIDVIDDKIDTLNDKVDRNYNTVLESIRLLNTPQGKRSTDLPACNGESCDFPNK